MTQNRSMAERENDRLVEQVRYREPLGDLGQVQQHLRDTHF
jgi:hypothetical protein